MSRIVQHSASSLSTSNRKLLCDAIDFSVNDIYGNKVQLKDYLGRGLLLCFFDDATRPLRNQRLLELTRRYKEWNKLGIDIVVVFNENEQTLKNTFDKKPRPFHVIADPKLKLYKQYRVKRRLGKGVITPINSSPSFFNTIFKGSFAWLNPVGRIMPANFLINTENKIINYYYGNHRDDHIAMDQLETFSIATRVAIAKSNSS